MDVGVRHTTPSHLIMPFYHIIIIFDVFVSMFVSLLVLYFLLVKIIGLTTVKDIFIGS